jgi:hypothetical protein
MIYTWHRLRELQMTAVDLFGHGAGDALRTERDST